MKDREPTSLSLVFEPGEIPEHLFPRLTEGTVIGLHGLLGRRPDNWTDPVGKLGKLALTCDEPWQRFARDWEAKRLGLLAQDLRLLKASNPEVFQTFRRGYRKLTFNEFFGWRHELRLAADLTARGIAFRKQEAPDFSIDTLSSEVFIECGSTNLTTAKDRDVSYKLKAVVDSKAAKPYANRNTALFVDFTNVLYSSAVGAQVLSASDAESALRTAFAEAPFGAIVATAMVVDTVARRFRMVGMAQVSSDATPDLSAFVEAYSRTDEPQWVSFVPVFSG